MDKTERFYKIDAMLANGRMASFQDMIDALQVSRSTLKRDLEYMRDRLNAPIVWDRETNTYRFETGKAVGDAYELPGVWFSAAEIHALLTMQNLLAGIGSDGLLGSHIKPLKARLEALLGEANNPQKEIRKRIKVLGMAQRPLNVTQFQQIGSSLLHRRRISILYSARSTDQLLWREVSPQRLVYYRDNWYLDAWCHLRDELRNFSLDRILQCEMTTTKSIDKPERQLDEILGASYGIFSGKSTQIAVLLFSASRAKWVSVEQWHPQQKSAQLPDGRFRLEIPYSNDTELVMDILRYGADVEVLEPSSLRNKIRAEAEKLVMLYTASR